MSNVTTLVPRDAIIIPTPSPQDWTRSQIVAGSIGAGIPLCDPAITDDEIVSTHRCYAIIYHLSRNALLRAGVSADKLDKIAAEAVLTPEARTLCIQRSTTANIVKSNGVGIDELSPENRVHFVLGAAAMLADVQEEFDRRGLSDPDDPRKMAQ